jgi:hypothetical protein
MSLIQDPSTGVAANVTDATTPVFTSKNAAVVAVSNLPGATPEVPQASRLTDGTSYYKATTPADTQPISAGSLPLPTGASTETTLSAAKTDLDNIYIRQGDGNQKTQITVLPITLDRQTTASLTGTGSVSISSQGCGDVGCQISGIWVGTLIFEATIDNTNWFQQILYSSGGQPFPLLTTTGNVSGRFVAAGYSQVRVRCSTYTSGTITISFSASTGSSTARTSMQQSVIASTVNFTTTNLTAGTSFTGVAETSLGVAGIQVTHKADQPCTLQIQQSLDGTNWDIADSYTVAANTGDGRTIQAVANYARLIVTNTGSSTTTYIRSGVAYCPVVEAVPRTLGQKTMSQSLAVTLASDQSSLNTKDLRASTATVTSVAAATSDTLLLAANSNRLGAIITNDSTSMLYLKYGSGSSSTSLTAKLVGGAYYEVPFNVTTALYGTWVSATGSARITEVTA